MRSRSSAAQDAAESKAQALLGTKPESAGGEKVVATGTTSLPGAGARVPREPAAMRTRSQAAAEQPEVRAGYRMEQSAAPSRQVVRESVPSAEQLLGKERDQQTNDRLSKFDGVAAEVDRSQVARDRADRQRKAEAPKEVSELTMGGAYERIIDIVFSVNPEADFDALRRGLRLNERASRVDFGSLLEALDESEDNAQKAYDLAMTAKTVHDAFEIDAVVLKGSMRSQAMSALQKEKDDGKRAKTITNDDVEETMAVMFPDQYRLLEQKRSRARRMVASLESLATRWSERAKDLRQMVARSRGGD